MGEGQSNDEEEKSARRVVRKLVVWTGEQSAFGCTCCLQVSYKIEKERNP